MKKLLFASLFLNNTTPNKKMTQAKATALDKKNNKKE